MVNLDSFRWFAIIVLLADSAILDPFNNDLMSEIYKFDSDVLVLGRKSPFHFTKKSDNINVSFNYWNDLIYHSRQNVLQKMVNHILNNNYTYTNITLNINPIISQKYFWFLYITLKPLINHLDIFTEIWKITYNSSTNILNTGNPFSIIPTSSNVLDISLEKLPNGVQLYIFTSFDYKWNLSNLGFIDDPWTSIYLHFNSYPYSKLNEIHFMKNIYQWKLSKKDAVRIYGLSCNIPNFPCKFHFISHITSTFSMINTLRSYDHEYYIYIDISNIKFENLNELHITQKNSILHEKDAYVIISKNQTNRIRNIVLSGKTVLMYIEDNTYLIGKISDLTNEIHEITANPFIMDFGFLNFKRGIYVCKYGYKQEYTINLMDLYNRRHKGFYEIYSERCNIAIIWNGFKCVKGKRDIDSVEYHCSNNGYKVIARFIGTEHSNIQVKPTHIPGCFNCFFLFKNFKPDFYLLVRLWHPISLLY